MEENSNPTRKLSHVRSINLKSQIHFVKCAYEELLGLMNRSGLFRQISKDTTEKQTNKQTKQTKVSLVNVRLKLSRFTVNDKCFSGQFPERHPPIRLQKLFLLWNNMEWMANDVKFMYVVSVIHI